MAHACRCSGNLHHRISSVSNECGDAYLTSALANRYAGVSFWDLAIEIAETGDTPFYVYFPDRAASAYRAFESAIHKWGEGHVAFSVKTNPLSALLRDLNEWGAFGEVVSAWEFCHALAAGFPPEHLVLNGPLKTVNDLHKIIRHPPLTINIDSLDELDTLERVVSSFGACANVGLRLCPPKDNQENWSRFGLDLLSGEVEQALARIERNSHLSLKCIHFHLGTQIEDINRYIRILMVVRELWHRHRFGRDVVLDIGGGFPYDHSVPFEEQTFSPMTFFGDLADAWGPPPRPVLLTEPGRFISASAMAIVSRVLAWKRREGEPTIVVVDSGTNHNVMAAFYEHLWSYAEATDSIVPHRICGPLCMEDDVLSGCKNGQIPKVGSLVAAFNSGAYSVGLSRTFIQPRPALFAFNGDGRYRLLQCPETLDNTYLFAREGHPHVKAAEQRGG